MTAMTINQTADQTSAQAEVTAAEVITLHMSIDAAALLTAEGERLIVCRFKNPARAIAANIPADAWTEMHMALGTAAGADYVKLLDNVLHEAAKSVLSRAYLNAWEISKVTISSVPAHLFTSANLLDEAAGNNSGWLTKDELSEEWKASATRAAVFNQQRYASDKAYQRAYTRFEELVLKLVGRNPSYKPEELDVILAKMADADMATSFGQFVVRRIEQIRNKPVASNDADLSML